MNQNEVAVYGATRFAIGTSTIVRVVAGDHVVSGNLRILAAGGTLEIVEPALSGSSTAAASGWGTGYAVGASEIISFYGPASFYFATTGATMTIGMMLGRTAGATTL